MDWVTQEALWGIWHCQPQARNITNLSNSVYIPPDYKYIVEVDILKFPERFSVKRWLLEPLEGAQLSWDRRSDDGRQGSGNEGSAAQNVCVHRTGHDSVCLYSQNPESGNRIMTSRSNYLDLVSKETKNNKAKTITCMLRLSYLLFKDTFYAFFWVLSM